MKVRFTQTRTTKTRPQDRQTFEKGKVYDLPDASANHWINRNVAERVPERAKAEELPAPGEEADAIAAEIAQAEAAEESGDEAGTHARHKGAKRNR